MFSELLGDVALNEAELQARAQDVVEREWPAWRRERAMRLGGDGLAALNAYFDELSAEVDAARGYHANLRAALAVAEPIVPVDVVPDPIVDEAAP